MRRAHLLAAVAVFAAACASPEQPARHDAGPADLVDSPGPHALAAPDIASWAAYREFNFDSTTVDISISDVPKLREIVAHLESDPSLDVGIDGTLGTDGVSQADRNLSNRRVASVRRALMDAGAGVASYKILIGPFADSKRRRTGRIQVLVGPRMGSPKAPL
jgi:outer membrane protein OmpA-like peptidoglycan-associated protein